MRVHMVLPFLAGQGGTETWLRTIDRELTARGHELHHLIPTPSVRNPDWDLPLRPRLTYLGLESEDSAAVRAALERAFAHLPPPDAVVAAWHPWPPAVRAAMAAQGWRAPVVSWLHLSPSRHRAAYALRAADAHLCLCRAMQAEMATIDPGKPAEVVGNPVEGMPFPPLPRPSHPTFVYVGRLERRQKRVDRLLRAVARLDPGSVRLRLVGGGPPAEVRALRALATRLGLEPWIEWVPFRPDPWSAVPAATALVLASDYEGFPYALLEALARGVPVVAMDCPTGPAEIVRPGENGWLVPAGDERALAAILKAVASGREPLPPATACQASVAAYAAPRVAARVEAALARWTARTAA
ncbi:MAG: glycosyltransferase [Firmicutes bacterium]|nr:glycosyltransferase [Bacillota bacterium]